MDVVYVFAPDRTPLMPCPWVIARLLLKDRKTKVVRRTPFTIKLYTQPENTYTQSLTLGVDTGSVVIGSAVANERGTILYLSEVGVRNDIAQTIQENEQQTPTKTAKEPGQTSAASKCTFSRTVIPIDPKRFTERGAFRFLPHGPGKKQTPVKGLRWSTTGKTDWNVVGR